VIEQQSTHKMIRHLRTRIGDVVRLIHTIHDDVCNATAMPRRLRLVEVWFAGAIRLVDVVNLWRVHLSATEPAKIRLVSDPDFQSTKFKFNQIGTAHTCLTLQQSI
jgi:hypothetical protein